MRGLLSPRRSLQVEAAIVLAFYAAYEGTRGLVKGDRDVAIEHGRAIAALERKLHLFAEPAVQRAAGDVPKLLTLLGGAYLTLHLLLTAALLLWLHQRRPEAFVPVRNTLLIASAIALVGFLLYPTAPPRLASVGLIDTVSGRHVDLNKGLVSFLYNPFAAIPSLHMGYALVVAGAGLRYARSYVARGLAIAYPLVVLLIIVATGNHFFFDAAAGAAVVAVAFTVAVKWSEPAARDSVVTRLPEPRRPRPEPGTDRLAA
jgi:membrane-associated phospholipid phosphatase